MKVPAAGWAALENGEHNPSGANVYDVTIAGAGVAGLTCALALQNFGFSVLVAARALPPQTVSDRAAALWLPHLAEPSERVLDLAERSLAVYAMQAPQEDSPVREAALTVVTQSSAPPWWASRLGPERLRAARTEELPEGAEHAVVALVPVIEPGRYLLSLLDAFRTQGGAVEVGEVTDLSALDGRIVVNCAGLGAGLLARDPLLRPLTRHAMRLAMARPARAIASLGRDGGLVLVVDMPDGPLVIGGEQDGVVRHEPDEPTLADVARTALALEPALAGADIVDAWAAPCPVRYALRLEEDRLPDGRRLIHNYGHGGAGWTLAWGCAEEVVRMVVRPEE
ncbi:FAD-dependent oxidoreductase [Fundidesulfovibrio butyratiphilus]